MILEHFSDKPLSLDYLHNILPDDQPMGIIFEKPKGLWVSVRGEYDWPNWCESNDFHIGSIRHIIEIDYENILIIDTPIKFEDFHQKYKLKIKSFYASDESINWIEVAWDFRGLIISPYLYQYRRKDWYSGWDCASGCIWAAKDVVKKIIIDENKEKNELEKKWIKEI
jgi:hypothetical protein